ncbi:dihydrolipoamide acetyltransferase family protein [Ideonella sp. DXS29W]|uniref:Dihydrolipoamide acetyltransferase component of pyruvate dehydrogenase complex n=1 Tax=Ideonella lacteola TaxID=2984193 RepID=A0ABU9BL17_9BURK
MTVHVIKMPDLGEGIAECELVAWHVKPGDLVKEDQVLADVMTDKATVEIPSSVAGRVVSLGGEVGESLAVGADLIRIERDGSAPTAVVAAAPAPARAPTPEPAESAVPAEPAMATMATPARSAPPMAAPRAATARAPVGYSNGMSGPNGSGVATGLLHGMAHGRVIASPALRERAWSLGVDLSQVAATGPGGRVMQRDLEEHVARHGAPGPVKQAPPPPAPMAAPLVVRPPVAAGEDVVEQVKFVGLRRKIAQRMQEAKRRIPHFSYVEEIDMTELESLRESLNGRHGKSRGKLTVLPFLARAMVNALRDFPDLNANFDDETGTLTRHSAVHIGIATQTDAGLMVPVLRDAQAHDLWSFAAEVQRLADAARSGRIVRDELSGSTITITSLGKIGGIVTTPVINMPEVAIVGVNRIVERPVIRQGAIVPRLLMNLSSSFDHRVVDGVQAAEFVQALREMLEHPAALFVE